MRPNHHQFVAFAYVVREGSFSAAASRLGVTQSTITQHVAKLEQAIGTQLLTRGGKGIEVTPTGYTLYNLADRLAAIDTEISERLEGFASMNEGRLSVIANAPQPALEIISRFSRTWPNIHIEFGLYDWTTATAMIRDRLADIGIITDAPASAGWEMHLLQRTKYVAYCRSDHPFAQRKSVSFKDIIDQTVILPEKGSLTEKVVRAKLNQLGMKLSRTVTMSTFPVMCEAVLQGIGVAIFLSDSSLIQQNLSEIPIKEFETEHETRLVVSRDRANLRLVSEFTSTALAGST